MIAAILSSLGLDATSFLLLSGVGLGALIAVYGFGRAMTEKSPAAARMEGNEGGPSITYRDDLIKLAQAEPSGIFAAFSPDNDTERLQVSQALARAGFRGANAPTAYYAVRVGLGLGLPAMLIGLIALAGSNLPWFPGSLAVALNGMSGMNIVQALAVLAAIGFFGPSYWLNKLIADRKRKIEEAFPNALDLMQIAVEAGLGLDAAMTRVATEIHGVAPDIAEEMLVAQSEIQAGRDRDKALTAMGRRCGIEEVSAFANVVLQSIQFGTPISDALSVYSEEMRAKREMTAQEKANKLPVQMSGVMAATMLPAIVMLILGPVVIRYINYFATH